HAAGVPAAEALAAGPHPEKRCTVDLDHGLDLRVRAGPYSRRPANAEAPMVDLVIRNGTIADGTGAAPGRGDVAIDGERIVAVAPSIDDRGRREIDAD